MSIRQIKDAKDRISDELIYFKGHAKATFMSDGSTVEEAINRLNLFSGNNGQSVDLSNYVTLTQLNTKQDKINDLDTIRSNAAKGATALQSETYKGTITGVSANGTSVATSGVANIPAASTSKYGVTKLTSSTSSTSTTLAATASAVKAAYDLANSKTNNTGTITEVKVNGTSIASSGSVDIPAASTLVYGVTKLSSLTNSTSTTLAATPAAVKSAYDLANNKQDKLVSGTNIKTINGQSLLGSGNINISGGTGSSSNANIYVLNFPDFILPSDEGLLNINFTDIITGIKNSDLLVLKATNNGRIYTYPCTVFNLNDDNIFLHVVAPEYGFSMSLYPEGNSTYYTCYMTLDLAEGYYTIREIDNMIGDINHVLESIISGQSTTFTFTVDGEEFTAKSGYSWQDAIDFMGFMLGDAYINGYVGVMYNGKYIYYNDSIVTNADIIIEDGIYVTQ